MLRKEIFFLGIVLFISLLGCFVKPEETGIQQIKLEDDYSLDMFQEHLRTIRETRWPGRGRSDMAFAYVFEKADWTGVNHDAALRLLGPADGELDYQEIQHEEEMGFNGKTIKDTVTIKEPYLIEPDDNKLIYRTGDGFNHGTIYTLLFENGFVSEVRISSGY